MNKTVAITSITGKVGKSTTGDHLLQPQMPNAKYFRLETQNLSDDTGVDVEKMKGKDLEKLQIGLGLTSSAIVDVGASNIESFLLALKASGNGQLDFDYFVVPIKAIAAEQTLIKEAIKTIEMLSALGIEPRRIRLLFNRLPAESDIMEEMAIMFNYHKKSPIFTINKNAVIHETPAFAALAKAKKTYGEMLLDKTDYRKMISDTPIELVKERTELVMLKRAQGAVAAIDIEMKQVFEALFED